MRLLAFLIAAALLASPQALAAEAGVNSGVDGAPSIEGVACAGAAVASREAALFAASEVRALTLRVAELTRMLSLMKAYGAETPGALAKTAAKRAWVLYENDVRHADDAYAYGEDAAWDAFEREVAACAIAEADTDLDERK